MASRRTGRTTSADSDRKWLQLGILVTSLAVIAALAALYMQMMQPGRLPLRVIEVRGEFSHLDSAAIEGEVINAIDGGFFDVNMQRVRGAVLHIPWVEQVSVQRVWPDTLRLSVTEQVPFAQWGERSLVNVHGEIFRPTDTGDTQGLVRLDGADEFAGLMVDFQQSLQAQIQQLPLVVRRIALDSMGEWQIDFDGLTLALGRDDTGRRLRNFTAIYGQLLQANTGSGQPQYVDMRYPHGLAVRWQIAGSGDDASDKDNGDGTT